MKYAASLIFWVILGNHSVWGQIASLDTEMLEQTRKNPVTFTHQPILLLKITPTALFENDNVFQLGGELAPPFGKFSFNFDYGIGRGNQSFNSYVRNQLSDTRTKLWRAEIRTYFSDWYPFYALDKKPFGRYYAVEVFNKTLTRTQPVGIGVGGAALPNFVRLGTTPVTLTEQGIHLKFGKHFIINRFFFVDAFAGIGPGRYELTQNQAAVPPVSNETVIHNGFLLNRKNWQINSKGIFLSRNAGIRLCLAL